MLLARGKKAADPVVCAAQAENSLVTYLEIQEERCWWPRVKLGATHGLIQKRWTAMDRDGQRWTVGLTMSLCCCKGLGVGIGRGWTNTTHRDCDEAGTMNKAQRNDVRE